MHNFKDFKIKSQVSPFVGDKVSVNKLIDNPITVIRFKIDESKKKEGTDCLTMQIEKGGEKRVVFTGAKGLISQIQQVPKENFPFVTTIKKNENDYCEFT